MTGDAASRGSFQHYRLLMEQHGFRPSRRLGQNFLLEPGLHRVIAESVAVDSQDTVLEVGPGLGFLTRELASRARHVVAVEIDPRLAAILALELRDAAGGERVEVLVRDVLERGVIAPEVEAALARSRPAPAGSGRLLVVANLPYSVTGPFLAEIVQSRSGPPDAMAILVQAEFADRLMAPPGGSEYGGPSALLQAGYQIELVRRVGREVFRPRPNVDSAVVRLSLRKGGVFASMEPELRTRFAAFIRALFASPRKTLRHGIARVETSLGLRLSASPERQRQRPAELGADQLLEWFHVAVRDSPVPDA